MERVKTHFNPKLSPVIMRCEFNKQWPSSTVAEYVATLRKIAEHYENSGILNDMLRDRLVCSIAGKKVQNRYLRESKLSYSEVRDLALAAVTADKDSKRLSKQDDSGVVMSVHKETIAHIDKHRSCKSQSGKHSSQRGLRRDHKDLCYHCGSKHEASRCRFKKEYDC